MKDVRLPPSRCQGFERRLLLWSRIQPRLQFLGNHILRSLFERNLLSGLLDFDGLADVTSQRRLQCRNLLGRGELNPAARLRLSDLSENVLRVSEQGAFEE